MKKFSLYLTLIISLTTLMILILSAKLPAQKSYVPTTINDFFLAGSQAGLYGYYSGDMNMDVQTDNVDKNEVLIINWGKQCKVPE